MLKIPAQHVASLACPRWSTVLSDGRAWRHLIEPVQAQLAETQSQLAIVQW